MRDYSFGNFLHELRVRRGLTQFQLGMLIGVSDKAVSKWENGSAKPQSGVLSRLGQVLGVSVDELLSCKYHTPIQGGIKGVFAMKNQIWSKALTNLREKYGEIPPVLIWSRYLTEQAELQNGDMIVYWELIARLSAEAKKQKAHINSPGGSGAFFVAYLLGASDVNPLEPHYYCPVCRKVEWVDTVSDGWDLLPRACSCGGTMRGEGHRIPFETYRHVVQRNTSFDISVTPCFFPFAKEFAADYFKDCTLQTETRGIDGTETLTVKNGDSACTFTLCADEALARLSLLEQATGTTFDGASFRECEVMEAFGQGETDDIPDFRSEHMKHLLKTVSPKSFSDLIRLLGLAHGTGTWQDNGEDLVRQGNPLEELVAYRDDVFLAVRKTLAEKGIHDTGYAYKLMEDTRKGRYARSGLPAAERKLMRACGLEEWFLESLCKIGYLFPKAFGVSRVEIAGKLMWYKLHFPKEFLAVMSN
ncbi:MAG: helix-turn-helix domain-containing protein [Clostridia bacterium]|nr:helix-turn-helix domain-containing protein [Clostridia bacterium]